MQRLQEHRHALGSEALLTLLTDDTEKAAALMSELWTMITAFEQRFSRFIASSELSGFNDRAGETISISQQFRALLVTCKELAQETDGLFNPFMLPALQRAGYVGSWPRPQEFAAEQDYSQRHSVTTIDALQIFKTSARIPHDSALDFGGIGKGYLLDMLSDYLQAHGYTNYWLSLGGDIICSGHDIDQHPWSVDVQSATSPDTAIGTITNSQGSRLAIATSGVTKRKGVKDAKQWHHIIDPRSGQPARTDLLTATITAADAVHADVYAKCLVILGSDQASKFIAAHSLQQAHLQTSLGQPA